MGTATTFMLKTIAPIGQFFGLLPYISIFKKEDLKKSLTNNGFSIEYEWQPKPDAAVFIIGKKI